jgi:hypothetical protein
MVQGESMTPGADITMMATTAAPAGRKTINPIDYMSDSFAYEVALKEYQKKLKTAGEQAVAEQRIKATEAGAAEAERLKAEHAKEIEQLKKQAAEKLKTLPALGPSGAPRPYEAMAADVAKAQQELDKETAILNKIPAGIRIGNSNSFEPNPAYTAQAAKVQAAEARFKATNPYSVNPDAHERAVSQWGQYGAALEMMGPRGTLQRQYEDLQNVGASLANIEKQLESAKSPEEVESLVKSYDKEVERLHKAVTTGADYEYKGSRDLGTGMSSEYMAKAAGGAYDYKGPNAPTGGAPAIQAGSKDVKTGTKDGYDIKVDKTGREYVTVGKENVALSDYNAQKAAAAPMGGAPGKLAGGALTSSGGIFYDKSGTKVGTDYDYVKPGSYTPQMGARPVPPEMTNAIYNLQNRLADVTGNTRNLETMMQSLSAKGQKPTAEQWQTYADVSASKDKTIRDLNAAKAGATYQLTGSPVDYKAALRAYELAGASPTGAQLAAGMGLSPNIIGFTGVRGVTPSVKDIVVGTKDDMPIRVDAGGKEYVNFQGTPMALVDYNVFKNMAQGAGEFGPYGKKFEGMSPEQYGRLASLSTLISRPSVQSRTISVYDQTERDIEQVKDDLKNKRITKGEADNKLAVLQQRANLLNLPFTAEAPQPVSGIVPWGNKAVTGDNVVGMKIFGKTSDVLGGPKMVILGKTKDVYTPALPPELDKTPKLVSRDVVTGASVFDINGQKFQIGLMTPEQRAMFIPGMPSEPEKQPSAFDNVLAGAGDIAKMATQFLTFGQGGVVAKAPGATVPNIPAPTTQTIQPPAGVSTRLGGSTMYVRGMVGNPYGVAVEYPEKIVLGTEPAPVPLPGETSNILMFDAGGNLIRGFGAGALNLLNTFSAKKEEAMKLFGDVGTGVYDITKDILWDLPYAAGGYVGDIAVESGKATRDEIEAIVDKGKDLVIKKKVAPDGSFILEWKPQEIPEQAKSYPKEKEKVLFNKGERYISEVPVAVRYPKGEPGVSQMQIRGLPGFTMDTGKDEGGIFTGGVKSRVRDVLASVSSVIGKTEGGAFTGETQVNVGTPSIGMALKEAEKWAQYQAQQPSSSQPSGEQKRGKKSSPYQLTYRVSTRTTPKINRKLREIRIPDSIKMRDPSFKAPKRAHEKYTSVAGMNKFAKDMCDSVLKVNTSIMSTEKKVVSTKTKPLIKSKGGARVNNISANIAKMMEQPKKKKGKKKHG